MSDLPVNLRQIHSEIARLSSGEIPFCVVTVLSSRGSVPRGPGTKMLVLAGGQLFGTIGGGKLEELARQEALRRLSDQVPGTLKFPLAAKADQCCGGEVDLFFEPLNIEPRLYVFGAGHVGQAVARVMQGTPFRVMVIDSRPEWLKELPAEVATHCSDGKDWIDQVPWSQANSYAAIMTPSHDLDEQLVERLADKPLKYLGLIGSSTKWRRFRTRLESREVAPSRLDQVRCPMGKSLGKSPQEVAISLAADLLETYYGALSVEPS